MPKRSDLPVGPSFVFDTNTSVSAAIKRLSFPGQALERALSIGQVCFSEATIAELELVLLRPKFDRYVDQIQRRVFLRNLLSNASILNVDDHITACGDPKDDKFLALALAARASHLITGDADLLALHPFRTLHILTPRDSLTI